MVYRGRKAKPKVSYVVHAMTDKCVFVIDDDKSGIIQAEEIVKKVTSDYGMRRVIYRDLTGRWDELIHHNGRFTGFSGYTGWTPPTEIRV